jgi:hypothetical protein
VKELRGKISNRIWSGEVAASKVVRETTDEEEPTPEAVRNAEGHGQGKGATRARSGE